MTSLDSPEHLLQTENAAAYALGAIDAWEVPAFERHLAGCATCRADVADLQAVTALLACATPTARPTAERATALRARVLRQAERAHRGPARLAWAGWLAAAASLALAALGGAAWRERADEAGRLRAVLAAREAQGAREAAVAGALLGPEVHVVSLTAPGAGPKPPTVMRVFWNHTRDRFVVTAHALPPAPAGRTYQLWAIARGKPPVSMGTFDADRGGRTATVLPVSHDVKALGFIETCALTLEPAGGSAAPSETPRLLGAWRHVD